MLVMISRLSTSRSRPSLSLLLIRHFSIRVSPLKKKSLLAQLLYGNKSTLLTKSTLKGQLSLAGPPRNGVKPTPLLQQGEASRSVYLHPPPPGLPAELGRLENGRQEGVKNDTCIDPIGKPSMRSKKEVQCSNVSAKLSVLQLRKGSKENHCEGETQLSVLSKLSVPSRTEGSKAHHSIGDMQPCARAQVGSKIGQASDCDEKPLPIKKRKVPAEASVPQVAREESSHSHVPAETKPGGKSLSSQIQGASQNPCRFVNKLGDASLYTDFSTETTSLASEVGGEPGKCIGRNLYSSEFDEEDDVRNDFLQLKSAVRRELSKRLEVEKLVELYSEMIMKEVPDNFLNDWQQRMSGEMDRFFNDLQQKIDFMILESVPLVHVKSLLMNRIFLSASPKKLAEVLTVLKLFFGSGDKAYEILAFQTNECWPPLEHLQQKLKVFVEFDVDKATGYRLATYAVRLHAERIRRNLSFLKGLGLSAESRNRMLYKNPSIIGHSVEKRMRLIVNFCESIEIAGPTLMRLLESSPAILTTSIDNLRAMYKLFQHVGLSSAEFTKVLRQLRFIGTDCLSQYNFFKEQGFSDEAFASIISRNPQIFSQSVAGLEAKLHFLLHKAKWDASEVVAHPRYFNYSLANRIIPRFKLLEERNLSRRPTLSTLIASKNLGFCTV